MEYFDIDWILMIMSYVAEQNDYRRKNLFIRIYVITYTMKDTRALPHTDIINRTTT